MIYFCDFSADNTDVGRESLARINEAIKYIMSNPNIHYNILLGAGLFKGNGQVAKELAAKKIKEILRSKGFLGGQSPEYFRLRLWNTEVSILLSKDNAWGTFVETLSMWRSFSKLLLTHQSIIFSSNYHIPRIKFIWLFFPKCQKEFLGVKVNRTLKEKLLYYLLEPLRYLKVIFFGLKLKKR